MLAAVSCSVFAEDPAPGKQVEQSLVLSDSRQVAYLLSLPAGYGEPGKLWPVMLFLHGRGESNGPLSIVAKWGPPRLAERGDDFPYILVSPQCPAETNWGAPEQQAGLLQLLDHVLTEYSADPNRVYLTGLSMGGFGSWRLAGSHPERFAAVVPICGGGNPEDAPALAKLPIWVFHGSEDSAVPLQRSVDMVEAVRTIDGSKLRFTTLEHVGHNSWEAAYASPDLYEWLNSHRREGE